DLFSELARPDSLRDAIRHLQTTFERFLLDGGTILALTGNHDNENFCQTLRLVVDLAAPATRRQGEFQRPGRLCLGPEPPLHRPAGRDGLPVQFLLMPYPTPARYLSGEEAQRYGSVEEKNQRLKEALVRRLKAMQEAPSFDRRLPTVLGAHLQVRSVKLPNLFRITEQDSILFEDGDLPEQPAYVALGHIHRGQAIRGQPHVRYCGTIERFDSGERRADKGVVLVELGPGGLRGEPQVLPLEATPIYPVEIRDPKVELPLLPERYPDAERALVNIEFTYTAGQDNL